MVAFFGYYRTLLPGLDLGDSASFQTIAGSLTLNPRQAYPLYFGLGNLFVWLHPGEPARAMNLASAVYGGIAVGLASWLAARLSDSVVAGIGAGLFLAFSYTFWSQAITAEVYTLHLMMVSAAGLAALAWAHRQTSGRLAVFYAIFAVAFGNHLSMALALPAFAIFLLMHRRPGAGDPLRPTMLMMAIGIAAIGALQYAWNLRGLWAELEPPATLAEALSKFWFDVTKEDWRETLVNTVSETGLQFRPAMYWFDLRQQVGVPGIVLAVAGFCYVLWRWPRRAVFLLLFFGANLAFAWTYNVGDAYIFFLPSHYVVALCAGVGISVVGELASHAANRTIGATAATLLLLYPAWRGYDTFPAVDRSADRRAEHLLDEFVSDPNAVYGVDTNWQVQNAFEYFMRERRPGTPWFYTGELAWLQDGDRGGQFKTFLRANAEIGRKVVITDRVSETVLLSKPEGAADVFADRVMSVPKGTPYVIAVLRSDREFPTAAAELPPAWQWLAPGSTGPEPRHYTVMAGVVGAPPLLVESQDRPYRVAVQVDGFDIDIRMESWLPTDTIRRAGFGHVIVNRHHVLTLERGISFIALRPGSHPIYASGLFAPLRKQLVTPP